MRRVPKDRLVQTALARGDRRSMSVPALFLGIGKKSGNAGLSLVLFCFAVLAATPALGQSQANDKLAPEDTIELRVSGWHALRGGVAEATLLNNTFTIGTAGTLDLPEIGQVPAAGLSAHELAKLIADRLQTRSGFDERPVTTVQRTPVAEARSGRASTGRSTAASENTNVDGRPPVAQPSANSSRNRVKPAASEYQQALERERSRKDALMRDRSAARMEILAARAEALAARQAAHEDAVRYKQSLAAERQRAAALAQAHSAADVRTVAQMAQQRKAVRALADEQHEIAARERIKSAALEQDLVAARREIDALKDSVQTAVAEREEVRRALAAAQQELEAMRRLARDGSAQASADREAVKAHMAQEIGAASRAKQAAEVLVNEQRELTRERAKRAALEQDLLAARKEIDALNGSAQTAVAERERVRRVLAAAQQELDAMRRVARDGSAQALAVADKQERAFEEQRQRAEALARELEAVQREAEGLKAKAVLATSAKAADVKARLAAEALLADARGLIDRERQKAATLERDLTAARQSMAALAATADQAVAAQTAAMRDLQAAKAAAERLDEAFVLQHERADAAARDLETARREHDAAKEKATRMEAAQREVFEDERDKASSLARELAAARKELDLLKARGERRTARVENAPKARATERAGVQSKPRSGRKSELREVRKVEVQKPFRSVRLTTKPLPAVLLPTRPPMQGLW